MRTLHTALAVGWTTVRISRFAAWSKAVAAIVATTAMVLGASFVAVAMSLA
jgi:hypothetical protein